MLSFDILDEISIYSSTTASRIPTINSKIMSGQCQISPIMFCIVCLEFVVCFISEKKDEIWSRVRCSAGQCQISPIIFFSCFSNAQPCVYMSFNPVYGEGFLKIKSGAVSFFFDSVLQSGINAQD
jgi:hypothetical protein